MAAYYERQSMDAPAQAAVQPIHIQHLARHSDVNLDSRSIFDEAIPRPYAADELVGREGERSRSNVDTYHSSEVSLPPAKATTPQASKHASVQPPSQGQGPPPPPFSSAFWDKNPDMIRRRKMYIGMLVKSSILVILAIFGILSIFWGSLFRTGQYIHNLDGWVVDFDGGPIGQTYIQAFRNNTGKVSQITWTVMDKENFPGGASDVEDAAVQEKAWVIVSINENASSSLQAAIASADASYNGSFAVTAYAVQARNEAGFSSFIQPITTSVLEKAAASFASLNARNLSSNSSIDFNTLLSQAPSVLTAPASFTLNNLRPFDAPVAQAVDFVGLIYLLIISFMVSMMHFAARVQASGLNRQLNLRSLLLLRIAAPIALYFVISLFFSLLSLAFQAPFSRNFGGWGFVIYWMMNWAAMCAMGLAMEAMITLLTPAFISYFLILWIISNVSVASIPIDVLPSVFKYGYATPFFNVSQAVRTILFGTRNRIGLNFGVQFVWIAISILTMTLFTSILRKREEVAWLKQQHRGSVAPAAAVATGPPEKTV